MSHVGQPPNILFLICDQLRKDALGCYGNPVIATPNIDRIAARGVRFDQAFAAYPVCAPNRAAMATGRYPSICGMSANGIRLRPSEVTMMEVLRQGGYRTYCVGKTHFGPQWHWPPDGSRQLNNPDPAWAINPQPPDDELPWYGFERVLCTEDNRLGPYRDYLAAHGYDSWTDPHSFSYPQSATVRSAYPAEHHQTAWVGDRTLDFLDEHPADRPFFMFTSFVDPHHPFTPPAPYDTMYDPAAMPLPAFVEGEIEKWPESYRRIHCATAGSHCAVGLCNFTDRDWQRIKAYYYGSISFIDERIGMILAALRRRNLLDNTIIVFTSDHGEDLGDHHLLFKGSSFDCVTSTPLIIADGRCPRDGASRSLLCSSIDLMPTLLELVGMATPDGVQGRSLMPALDHPDFSLRDELLIENGGVRRLVRTRDHLFAWHGPDTCGELYDLRRDPGCHDNLWDDPAAAGRRAEFTDRLLHLMARNLDPLPPRLAAC